MGELGSSFSALALARVRTAEGMWTTPTPPFRSPKLCSQVEGIVDVREPGEAEKNTEVLDRRY